MGLFSRRNDADYDDHYDNSYNTTSNRYGNMGIPNHGGNRNNNDVPMNQNSNIVNDGTNTHHGLGHGNQGLGRDNTIVNDGTNVNHGLGHHNQTYGRDNNIINDGTTHNHGVGHNNRFDNDGYNDGYDDRKGYNNRRGRGGGGGGFLGGLMGNRQRRGTQRGRFADRDRRHEKGLSHSQSKRDRRALFDIDSGYYNRRPSFGQWIKFTWMDLLTMVIMGAIGLGVYEAQPAPSRSFPVTFLDGEVVYPQFAYPLRKNIIPIWAAALMASLIPIFIILCMQIRIRSFWDANNAIIGLLYSLIGAAVFQVFVKWLIGGLRPHFLTVCDPDPSMIGTGYGSIMFDRSVCRGNGKEINDSLESMPSGHSTAAFAGFLYLYFYLNAKLKVFSNHHPAMWKLIALYAPVLGATLVAGSLTIDEYHNWYDCLAGGIIGSVFALSAYRMVYASVWDFRFNHIPLTRHTPFSYGAGPAGAGGFESTVFTRKAGWGFEEAYGGAPFDAAHGLRGQAMGFNQGAPGRHGGAGIMGNKLDHDVERNAGTNTIGHGNHRHGQGLRDNDGLGNNRNSHGIRDNDVVDNTNRHSHGIHNNDGYDATTGTHVNNMHQTGTVTDREGGALGNVTGHHHQHGTANTNTVTPINTRTDGVNTNRDSTYLNEPTTPTRVSDGRYHHHNRSLERKQVPPLPTEANQGVGTSERY